MPRAVVRTAALAACLAAGTALAAPSADLADYVLVAEEELNARRLSVESGDVAVNAGRLRSFGGIRAPSSRVAADLVDIDATSQCGELAANAVREPASACGPPTALQGPLFADLAAACGAPEAPARCDPSRPVSVGHRAIEVLPPGVYGDLRVAGGSPGRGTLVLEGGGYVFCSVHVGPRARLQAREPVTVEIAGRANFGVGSTTGPAAGSGLGGLDGVAVFVAGDSARFQRHADFVGSLCAPNGTLHLMHGTRLEGRGVARVVRAGRVTVRGTADSGGTTSTTVPTPTTTSTSSTTTSTGGASSSTSITSTTSVPVASTTSSTGAGPGTTSTSTSSTTSTTVAKGSCGGDGRVEAAVELAYPATNQPPSVLRLGLSYPDFAEVPGTGDAVQVRAAVTDLSGVGILVVNDDDAARALTVGYLDFDNVIGPNLVPGAVYRLRLEDCPAGTPVGPDDFDCTVAEAGDALGAPLPDVTCRVQSVAVSDAGPTTTTMATTTTSSTSSSSSSTVTVTTSTTTSTAGGPSVCGNGTVEAPETCDDGNALNADTCPADCTVDPCDPTQNAAAVLAVTLDNEQGSTFGVATVFVDYPEGLVFIPGSVEDAQVQAAVTDRPTSGSPTCLVNDRDHGLQFGCFSFSGGFLEGLLFRVAFRDCRNPTPPTPQDFTCEILEAADTIGSPVFASCGLQVH